MKNKGFTLVELLAVVVVLAIVSIIAIPITLNIIENARKGALENSARGLMDAANNYYAIHSKEIEDYVDFSIVNGKQTSSEKLSYKGSIDNGYLRLVDANTMALCIDDNKYYVVKNLDSKELELDEGVCSGEYDEELLGYVTIGNASYTGLRLNVKAYATTADLPNKSNAGTIAVITNDKITDYYVSSSQLPPTELKEGMVWLVQSSETTNVVENKKSKIGIGYAVQYLSGDWQLKEAYVYNNEWVQLSYIRDSYVWDFDYSGEYKTFTAPYSGYYTIELWGASGGDYNATYVGGNGAYTKGDIYLNVDEEIYVYVGGEGGATKTPGWNGGAIGNGNSSSGGGATDVRTIHTASPTVWNEIESLKSRIMVAGAGSGAAQHSGSAWASKGGAAGGLESYAGETGSSSAAYAASVATQIAGGKSINSGASYPATPGGFGYGGASYQSYDNPGGGSGWFGGAGGAYAGGQASGGSSYISGHDGCIYPYDLNGTSKSFTGKYFINTIMIDGQGYNWTTIKGIYMGTPSYSSGSPTVGNDGNGYARITFSKFATYTNEQYDDLYFQKHKVWRYQLTGTYQTFTAPYTGKYKFELWGASGGDYSTTYIGGNGAYTSGEMNVNKGQTLYIYVGGQGGATKTPGWNGGAIGNGNSTSGGGATDVRISSTSSNEIWNEIESLKTRIMVAGAGSGAAQHSGSAWASKGGAAGGLESYAGETGSSSAAYAASVATQTTGGKSINSGASYPATPGGFGYGGASYQSYDNPGGGSGWYGGAGGAYAGGQASGGSSYISGHDGCVAVNYDLSQRSDSISYTGYKFTNTKMVDGTGYKWTTSKGTYIGVNHPLYGTEQAGNDGNGYAKITYIGN